MKKVMCFGTFDVVHKGHEYYLKEARKLGDYIVVVVALDETVTSVKGKSPMYSQDERLKRVKQLEIVDRAILGNRLDKLKVVEEEKPDILAFGYDQRAFTDRVKEKLQKRGLEVKIVRMKAFHPDRYKSSLLKKE